MTMRSMVRLTSVLAALGALLLSGSGAAGAAPPPPQPPNLGTNVLVFDPSMSTAQIQAAVDAVAAQQVDNEFGSQRYALLFKPGTYGTATQPLTFQVGYYTEVAGLGASPTDVTGPECGRAAAHRRTARVVTSPHLPLPSTPH